MPRVPAPLRPARAALALVVLASALLGGLPAVPSAHAVAPTSVTLDCAPDPVRCPSRPYLGVFTPEAPRDLSGLQRFGDAVGKQPSVALYFQTFNVETDLTGLRAVDAAGRLPMVTWEPFSASYPTANPFPLRDIAAGRFDAYLQRQAETFAAFGRPAVLRLAHEMNGNWYPWGRGVNGNTDADYVAMWRHVHDLFTAAGADNVIWLWSPNVTEEVPERALAGRYPGDAYVDWVGLTGYFDEPGDRFDPLYRTTLPEVDAVAPRKPVYIAETSVLPGPGRAAQIHDLVPGLLSIPRLIGVNWFEKDIAARFDWRISGDPAGREALAQELASPWFLDAADPTAPISARPVLQVAPGVSGTADVGAVLTGTTGTWLSSPDSGPLTYSASWHRCPDRTSTSTCTAVSGPTALTATSSYTARADDLGQFLRLRVTAGNSVGGTAGWSAPTSAVLTTPSTPAAPQVEARDRALRVLLPPAPAGTTHWRLTVDGVARPLIPLATPDAWLVGLTNSRSYTLTLTAAALSTTAARYSPPVTLTALPLLAPPWPKIGVVGDTATFTLPPVPAGATRWTLTLDGTAHDLPTSTTTWTAPTLRTGQPHSWSLTAGAGTAPGRSTGASTLPTRATSTLTPLATPTTPTITTQTTSATLTFPALPPGATTWRATVGAGTYTTTNPTLTVTGLRPGTPTTWTLRATNPTAWSHPTTGTLTTTG